MVPGIGATDGSIQDDGTPSAVQAEAISADDFEEQIANRVRQELNTHRQEREPVLVEAAINEERPGCNRNCMVIGIVVATICILVGVVVGVVVGSNNGGDGLQEGSPTISTLSPGTSEPSASPTTSSLPNEACQFKILEATDLLGSDFSTPVPMGSLSRNEATAWCRSICSSIPFCSGSSLTLHTLFPYCYLKETPLPSPTEASSEDEIVSGIRQAAGFLEPTISTCIDTTGTAQTSYDVRTGTNLFGNNLFPLCLQLPPVTTLEEATTICTRVFSTSSICKGFTAVDPSAGFAFPYYACCLKSVSISPSSISDSCCTTTAFKL